MNRWADTLLRTVAPLALALAAGGLVIWAMGANPLEFYGDVLRFGLTGNGWQQTLTAMAPLLLVAMGLIVAFRAGLWNLGGGGTFVLAAAVVAGLAPSAFATLPFAVALAGLFVASVLIGMALALLPALLKARRGTNEIITSLMVSFTALGLAGLLVRGPLQDPEVTVPQTRVLDLGLMLPYLPGTRAHVGLAVALIAVVATQVLLMHSSFGIKVDMLGASPRATAHAGVNVTALTVTVFLISGGLIALAAALDMLGLWGYMRADWNPGYADKILPFVFLARLHPLGTVPLVAFYATLATGGAMASQRAGLSVDVLLVIVAFVLFFMVLIEAAGQRRSLGRSYLAGRAGRAGRIRRDGGGEIA